MKLAGIYFSCVFLRGGKGGICYMGRKKVELSEGNRVLTFPGDFMCFRCTKKKIGQ